MHCGSANYLNKSVIGTLQCQMLHYIFSAQLHGCSWYPWKQNHDSEHSKQHSHENPNPSSFLIAAVRIAVTCTETLCDLAAEVTGSVMPKPPNLVEK